MTEREAIIKIINDNEDGFRLGMMAGGIGLDLQGK